MKKNIYVIFLSIAISVILWVSISLSNDYSANLKLPVRFFNVPEGFVPVSPSTETVSAKVRGKGWNLLSIKIAAQNNFFVDAGHEIKKNHELDLLSFAAENTWLTSKLEILEIIPETISFSFEKIERAKLKIMPDLRLEFKPGYGLASDVFVVPESTYVSGADKKIKEMTEIATELLELSGLSEKTEMKVDLKHIPDLNYEIKATTIVLNVQQIVEQTFNDIKIKVIDIPVDRDVVLFPNQINVSLRGGIDVLGKLDKQKLTAFVYYRDIVLDTIGSVTPKINIPGNTELVFVKPNNLKYVIKKFNK